MLYALACLAGYLGALGTGLLSDDFLWVQALEDGRPMASWGREHGGFFRPVAVASMWLDVKLLGGRPFWMHVENVLIHALCAWLVQQLAARVFAGVSGVHSWAAPLAAALFALHPSHAEAVVWISGRGDLLATAFGIAGLTLALDFLRHGRAWRCWLMGAAWLAAVLSKESALALPGVLVALALATSLRVPWRRLGVVVLSGGLVLGIWLALRIAVLGELITGDAGGHRLDMSSGKLIGSLKRQLLRSVFPAVAPGDSASLVLAGVVGAIVLVAVALFARSLAGRRSPPGTHGWILGVLAAYFLALVPVLGSKVHVDGGEGERFVYLPTAIAAVGMAGVIAAGSSRRIGRFIALAWLLAYGLLVPLSVLRWRAAGRFTREVVQTLVAEAHGPRALVLDLPDSVEGAYVLRNGLGQAVARERAELEAHALLAFTADREGGGAQAIPVANASNAWTVVASRPWPYLALKSPELVRDPAKSGELGLETRSLWGFSDIFAFHEGRLIRVGPAQQ